jgi:hypothetical protein
VSRSWASREANAPGTRILVAELLDSQRGRMNELFDQTLNVTKDVFGARKIFVVRGVIVDGGPDPIELSPWQFKCALRGRLVRRWDRFRVALFISLTALSPFVLRAPSRL